MIKLDENKLAKLRTSSEHLTEKYGSLDRLNAKSLRHVSRLTIMQNCLRNSASSRR